MLSRSVEICLAVVFLLLALLVFFVWIPLDSETPAIYEFRRQVYIGDAMLPLVAAAGIGICALVHLILQLRRSNEQVVKAPFDSLTLVFFAWFVVIVTTACLLIFWAGPAALAMFGPSGDEAVTYRQMRTTAPWKYVGFVLGGFVMVFGLTSLIDGSMRFKRAISSLLLVIVLIVVFDVPFDTILLPPNGDF